MRLLHIFSAQFPSDLGSPSPVNERRTSASCKPDTEAQGDQTLTEPTKRLASLLALELKPAHRSLTGRKVVDF